MSSDDTDLYNKGSDLALNSQFEEAIEVLYASLRLYPHPKTAELIGTCYLNLGKSDEAIVFLAAACGLGKQPHASVLLAKALVDRGLLNEARAAVTAALDILPHYKKAQELLVQIDREINERDTY